LKINRSRRTTHIPTRRLTVIRGGRTAAVTAPPPFLFFSLFFKSSLLSFSVFCFCIFVLGFESLSFILGLWICCLESFGGLMSG
jgi:hypothetical protein